MSTTGVSEHPMPAPIPTPPTFPVTWEQPDDERLYWLHDRLHFPAPITPMDGWALRLAYQHGYATAA